MIKNIFKRYFGLSIFVLFGCFGISFGYEVIQNCYNVNYTDLSCYVFDSSDYFVYENNYNIINSKRSFDFYGVDYFKAFSLQNLPTAYSAYSSITIYWNDTSGLNLIYDGTFSNTVQLFSLNKVCRFNGTSLTGVASWCGLNTDSMCNVNTSRYSIDTAEFINQVSGFNVSTFYFYPSPWRAKGGVICGVYENVTYCLPVLPSGYSDDRLCGLGTLLESNMTNVGNGFDYYSSFFGNSPFDTGGGGGDSGGGTSIPVTSDVDYAINYYESTKGFNKNMCYVGTNDLSADYGASGISFENGTGATIFELYYSLYSGYGSNIITNVGKFINVRTLNYGQWFYNRDNILWLATDNGPDSNVTYIYTGFTFPFANKPVGIYFMASNLMEQYFSESSMGNDVSYYCYIKLNYSSIESGSISYTGDVLPLVPDSLVNNVDDYVKYQLNYGESGYYLGLDWNNSYTGEYQLTDNLELDNVFISFVDKLNSKLGNISISYSLGIIPDRILYPLIFLILFRIMKH